MLQIAAVMPYRSVLKETSSVEIVIFLILLAVLLASLIIRMSFLRMKDRRQSARALVESTIRTNHLTPAEADLFRRLVSGRSITGVLHDRSAFGSAVEEYLSTRGKEEGTEPASMEELRKRFTILEGKLHFRSRPSFSPSSLPSGARVKVWLRGKGLFSAVVETNERKGMWIGLPHWIIPAGTVSRKLEMVVYYWDSMTDYEIHGYVGRIKGRSRIRLFMPHSSTVFKGRHPQGMNVETDIPVLFQRILDIELPEEDAPQLHILQGRIVSISVIGAEVITRIKGQPGSLYRFEFDTESGGRRKHWFIGRVTEVEKEKVGNRIYVRFMDVREKTRELIDRFVCRRVNRGGVSTLPAAPSEDTRP